ncbi:MAG: spore germination protein, partial [Bacillota bacterium]
MRTWNKNSGWTSPKEQDQKLHEQQVLPILGQNLELFKMFMGNAPDLIIREFTIASDDEIKAAIVAVEGMVDKALINEQLLARLMLDIRFQQPMSKEELFQRIKKYGISNLMIKEDQHFSSLVNEIIFGNTVFLLDGLNKALIIESKGWQDRPVSEPATEGVVRGPRDGFTETIKTNMSLIRRRIKSPDLRIYEIKVGERTQTEVFVVYLEGVARQETIEEVKERILRIKIDGILESGYIEELIEDSPLSPFPQVEHSERPDKVAGAILEGRIAILVDTTPFVLMVPTVFFQFLQSSEDYYERFYVGSV